jgi:hypothetical protein
MNGINENGHLKMRYTNSNQLFQSFKLSLRAYDFIKKEGLEGELYQDEMGMGEVTGITTRKKNMNPNKLSHSIFNDNKYLHQSFDNTFDGSLLPEKMQLPVQFL